MLAETAVEWATVAVLELLVHEHPHTQQHTMIQRERMKMKVITASIPPTIAPTEAANNNNNNNLLIGTIQM